MGQDDPDLGADHDDSVASGRGDLERYGLMAAVTLLIVLFLVVEERHRDAPAETSIDRQSVVVLELGGRVPPVPARPPVGRRNADPAPAPVPAPQPEPVPEPISTPEPREVVVAPGEVLSVLVQRELGTVRRLNEVMRLNGLSDANAIRAGQTLLFPAR